MEKLKEQLGFCRLKLLLSTKTLNQAMLSIKSEKNVE